MAVLSAAELHCFVWGCLIQKKIGSDTVVLLHKYRASEYYKNALDLVSHKSPRFLSLSHAKFSKEVEEETKRSLLTLAARVKVKYHKIGEKSEELVKSKRLFGRREETLYQLLLQIVKAIDSSSKDVMWSPDTWLNILGSSTYCQTSASSEEKVKELLGAWDSFMQSMKQYSMNSS